MEQSGEHRIDASRDRVWAALNDPAVLQRCIDGCEALERDGDNLTAKVRAKVGPLSAVFTGEISLKDIDPPNGYRLEVSAKSGAAGFAKGEARVRLEEEGGRATLLKYSAQGSVGGKLAQIGQRLIDATARKTADDFFEALAREVEAPAAETAMPVSTGVLPAAQAATPSGALVWGGIAAALLVAAMVAWRLMAR